MTRIAGGPDDVAVLLAFGANFGPLVAAGDLWRLVASIFLHGDLFHLAFNALILFVLGRRVEGFFGAWTMTAIFVLSGVAGSAASAVWSKMISVGASGGIHGLIGTAIAFAARHPALLRRPFRWPMYGLLAVALVVDVTLGVLWQRVDVAAHLGGLAAGIAFGVFLTPAALVEAAGLVPQPPRLLVSLTIALLGVSAVSAGSSIFRLRGEDGALLDPRVVAALSEVDREHVLEALNERLERSPDDPALLRDRAEILWIGEDWAASVRDYRRLLEITPQDAMVRNNLAWLLLEEVPAGMRDPAEAARLAESAVALDPDDPYARGTWATALLRRGEAGAAIPEFERALSVPRPAPDDATDRYLLAIALVQVGRREEAQAMLLDAIERDPGNRYREESASAVTEGAIQNEPAP